MLHFTTLFFMPAETSDHVPDEQKGLLLGNRIYKDVLVHP